MEPKPLLVNRLLLAYLLLTFLAPLFGFLAILGLAFYVAYLEIQGVLPEDYEPPDALLEDVLFEWGFLFANLVFLRLLLRYLPRRSLAPGRDAPAAVALTLAYGLATSLITAAFLPEDYLVHLRETIYPQTPAGWVPFAVSAVLLAPVIEEGLFRGLMLSAYARARGPVFALYAQAGLFALAHGDPVVALDTFGFAWIAGRYALRHGRLGAPILAHALGNAAAVAQAYQTPEPEKLPAEWGYLGILLLVLVLWVAKRRYPLPEEKPTRPEPVLSASLMLFLAIACGITLLSTLELLALIP